jgi:hypothetical protein
LATTRSPDYTRDAVEALAPQTVLSRDRVCAYRGPCVIAAYRSRRIRTLLAIAASISIVVCLMVWPLLLKQKELLGTQTVVLDLRSRSVARGTEQNPSEPPLEIERKVSHLKIYLPLGSTDGEYGVRISRPNEKILFTTKGVAELHQGITSLSVDLSRGSARPGLYLLEIQKADSGWTAYPLRVR